MVLTGATAIVRLSAHAQTAPAPMPVPAMRAPAPAVAHPNHPYLKLDGIPGESTDVGHVGWIDVLSFQWGGSAGTSAAGAAVRASQGRRSTVSSIVITKGMDKSSTVLQKAATTGQHLKTAVLEMISASKNETYRITLSDAVISSLRVSTVNGRPTESITFVFGKLEIQYGKADADAGTLRTAEPEWDIRNVTLD
jgi:type VI secretion system Hcp family effector